MKIVEGKEELIGFKNDRVARFVITDFFVEDYILTLLEKYGRREWGCQQILYSVYNHSDNYVCHCKNKTYRQGGCYLTL